MVDADDALALERIEVDLDLFAGQVSPGSPQNISTFRSLDDLLGRDPEVRGRLVEGDLPAGQGVGHQRQQAGDLARRR